MSNPDVPTPSPVDALTNISLIVCNHPTSESITGVNPLHAALGDHDGWRRETWCMLPTSSVTMIEQRSDRHGLLPTTQFTIFAYGPDSQELGQTTYELHLEQVETPFGPKLTYADAYTRDYPPLGSIQEPPTPVFSDAGVVAQQIYTLITT
jgi:hypothetical protein